MRMYVFDCPHTNLHSFATCVVIASSPSHPTRYYRSAEVRVVWYMDQPLREVRSALGGLTVSVNKRVMDDKETPTAAGIASAFLRRCAH